MATKRNNNPSLPNNGFRRFEFSDGRSNKFWEVKFFPSTGYVKTLYGRIGQTARESTKYATRTSYYAIIRSKVRKGYVEVTFI